MGAPTFRLIKDQRFIKLLFGFAIARYCVYTLLPVVVCPAFPRGTKIVSSLKLET